MYIKKIFQDGAPADFILIGATTRDPSEINPALRSRTAEVFFEPLTQGDIQKIVENAANRLHVKIDSQVPKVISDYTIEGRKATNILIDALGVATQRIERGEKVASEASGGIDNIILTLEDLEETIRGGRLSPYVHVESIFDVSCGQDIRPWSCRLSRICNKRVEAVCFKSRGEGKGQMRFNDTAGSMAKDSRCSTQHPCSEI